MFGSGSLAALQGGRNSIDLPVAALAGLSVAFLAFAAPADMLAELVGATGLPSILPAAEPPLGLQARIGIGGAAALMVFAITFLVLRRLDRMGSRRDEGADEAEAPAEPLRLRRRDIHPDAPSRPPLLAVHELGEPELELSEIEPSPPSWDEAAPVPAVEPEWLQPAERDWNGELGPAEPETQFADPLASWENGATQASAPETEFPDPLASDWENGAAQASEPAPDVAAELRQEWIVEESPADEGETEPSAAASCPWPADPSEARPFEPEAERTLEPTRPQGGTIAELLERLEQGLARHRAEPAASSAPPPAPAPDPADARLQNAIDSLQRFASRRD